MHYKSTRGGLDSAQSAEVISMGIAPDGGLFVPEEEVKFSLDRIGELTDMDYRQRAMTVLGNFLDDYTEDELKDCVYSAYSESKFDSEEITPVHKLGDNIYILELFHGPTCAFKDVALQILPHLLVKAVRKLKETEETVILVATSGDTGKAALEGFKDVEGTRVIVFFPKDGVSKVQKLQMITQEGSNVHSVGVEGNFDDAQNGVKAIFTDEELRSRMKQKGFKFSSANSINWGRLVPQIVYYFSAYADLVARGEIKLGDMINFAVPTGNFGNILAGYYAKKMGLPVNKLICASNENNVLTDFINSGVYDKRREFIKTCSPSMDILISSNLERLLYDVTDENSRLINDWMGRLRRDGFYNVGEEVRRRISQHFWGGYSTESETLNTIEAIYKEHGYVVDTHTAVAIDVYDKYVISTGDMTKTVILATASPFKFSGSVVKAVFGEEAVKDKSEFQLLEMLSERCGIQIPKGLKDLEKRAVKHNITCSRTDMKKTVESILKI